MKANYILITILVATLLAEPGWCQFDSGSDGSDGALELTVAGTYDFFDPSIFPQPVDVDGDRVYHFTRVDIGPDVQLTMRKNHEQPITWLVSESVTISGTVDLDGSVGHDPGASVTINIAGAGGFQGGRAGNQTFLPFPGSGPGGGAITPNSSGPGAGAGHLLKGLDGQGNLNSGGRPYGNEFLLPLVGGSGGAGGKAIAAGASNFGSGGGAGGGALLVAATDSIAINGVLSANGGDSGDDNTGAAFDGGGGSGGAVRLISNRIVGNGTIRANKGVSTGAGGDGAHGRIRMESFATTFSGAVEPLATFATPGLVFLPEDLVPIRITAINGVAVPARPLGATNPADLTLDVVGDTVVAIATTGIPIGTELNLTMVSETGIRVATTTTPLAGTLENGTATATVAIPHGFSRFFVDATWDP